MKLNYSKTLIDPYNIESVKTLNSFPEFNAILKEEFYQRFIIFMVNFYDINSELKKMYTNHNKRRFESAKLAGFEVDENNRFFDVIDINIITGQNKLTNMAISRYLIMHGKPDILAYISFSEILAAETTRSLSAGILDSKEIKDMRQNIQLTTQQLNELYPKIFGGEEGIDLKNALYETLERDKLGLRPEDVSSALNDKAFEAGIDPYGVGGLEYED